MCEGKCQHAETKKAHGPRSVGVGTTQFRFGISGGSSTDGGG